MYKVALGYDNTGGLTDLVVQPRCRGLGDARRLINGDGLTIPDGGYIAVLEYGYLSKADWLAILTQFGLHTGLRSKEITVTLPDNINRAFGNYNAIVLLPELPNAASFERGRFIGPPFELTQIWGIVP